jgi:predicted XRE-type DNA-binding protein
MKKSLIELLEELKKEIICEVLGIIRREFSKPTKKEFYSFEEVSVITGLTKSSIKGRYRRGTIERVYSGN